MSAGIFQGSEVIEKYQDTLVEKGLISQSQLAIAKISQENLGLDLGAVLIKKKFVDQNQLLSFVADVQGIPFISLKDIELDPEVVHKLPFHLAKQNQAVPFGVKDGKVQIAMANPFSSFIIEDIKEMIRSDVIPYLVNAEEIDEVLASFVEHDVTDQNQLLAIEVTSAKEAEGSAETKKMEEMASGPKVVAMVNNILAKANNERASDIHIEPQRDSLRIRFRVDGLLRERGNLDKSMQLPITSRVKILGGLDIAERRVPQDGRVRILLVGKPLDLRISTCPTQHGEKIVIRLLAKEGVKSIDSLGFSKTERKTFQDIITKSHGIFLVTGPTGSGKSTTLYAALGRINSSDKNIISIEDPIESEIEGVNQVQVNNKAGLTFAGVLRSVLRQDPDIVMLGEIRDSETGEIAVRAAITGHLVLSTLHTNTALGAISRLEDLGVEKFMIATALKGVLAQRLVRRICQHCKEETSPDISKYGLKDVHIERAFVGKGCEACGYSGYGGRMGIFELVAIDEKIRKMITAGAGEPELTKQIREDGVRSIVQYGLDKVAEGLTTIEEVFRVTQED